jgi:hypothetical protein
MPRDVPVDGRTREDLPVAGRRDEAADVVDRSAQVAVLSRLARGDDDVLELMSAALPFDVRGHFTPDVALLEVAAAALGLACRPGGERLQYAGVTDRYLPDVKLDGRTVRHRTQYALYAAACMRGGLHPDLLGEAGRWEPRLWTYAVSAGVLYSRAAADRTGLSVAEVALKVADQLRLQLPVAQPSD